MDLRNIKDVLALDTSSPFSVNAFLTSIRKNSLDAVESFNSFMNNQLAAITLPFTNGDVTGVISLTQQNFQTLEETGQTIVDFIEVGANTVSTQLIDIENCCATISQNVQSATLLSDLSNSISSTQTLNEFVQTVSILENKYVTQGSDYASGIISSLKEYISSNVDEENWLSAVLGWITNLSNEAIVDEATFDPSNFFNFDEYSDMSALAAWVMSINFDINWNNIADKIAGVCATVIHGITYLANKTAQGFRKLYQKIADVLQGTAYKKVNDVGKGTISGFHDRLYTFDIEWSGSIYDNLIDTKLDTMAANGFPTLQQLGITSTFDIEQAFELNKLYHFDFPGCVVSIMKYHVSGILGTITHFLITYRPKLYSLKVQWTRNGVPYLYPATISECVTGVLTASQIGWMNQLYEETDLSLLEDDHRYASGFNRGSAALAGVQLALIAAATKDPSNYTDAISQNLINFFTLQGMPAGPTDHTGFGCPGTSTFSNTDPVYNLTSQQIIDALEANIGADDESLFYRSTSGYAPKIDWFSSVWCGYPIIALISCYIAKENGTYFVPYLKSNYDISGAISLTTTSDQAAMFSSFTKKVVTAAAVVAAVAIAFKVRRKIVNKALAASSQYEQFYYKATTSDSDIALLRKMRFKSKVWNAIAGVRVTASDGLVIPTVNTNYEGPTYKYEGDKTELLIKLICG